jgi:hypothetical protein
MDGNESLATHLVPMPMIVGSPRSGTTLLRFMLDAHPDLAIPPETGFVPTLQSLAGTGDALRKLLYDTLIAFPPDAPGWSDFGIAAEDFKIALDQVVPFDLTGGIRAFYRLYALRFGKTRYGDKTPLNSYHLLDIQRLLPEAHFVHVIRDGRAVAASLRKRWFSPGHDITVQAQFWRANVLAAREHSKHCRKYCEVRYESLLQAPESTLRTLCDFLELDFHPSMLDYHQRVPTRLMEHGPRTWAERSFTVSHAERVQQQVLTMQPPVLERIDAWRKELTPEESETFESVAGELLKDLGYC